MTEIVKNLEEIQENILFRYKENGRDLHWRQTQDPYAIHVSEVMLQQTQVDRVIPYFHKWLKKWPDYAALSKASNVELLGYWSGLGFNSRALRLKKCAEEVCNKSPLVFSSLTSGDPFLQKQIFELRRELMKLPGIGSYTSAAILAFAYNLDVPVVDTNIRRVLMFLFKLDTDISDRELEKFALRVVPKGRSRDWHNALMDYGALKLTARKTGIKSKSKQSKFEGSDRQVRGWIVKYLLKYKKLSLTKVQEEFPRKDVDLITQIVADLVKENIVDLNAGLIKIKQ